MSRVLSVIHEYVSSRPVIQILCPSFLHPSATCQVWNLSWTRLAQMARDGRHQVLWTLPSVAHCRSVNNTCLMYKQYRHQRTETWSIVISGTVIRGPVFVGLLFCEHISGTICPNFTEFSVHFVARFSSGCIATCCVLPAVCGWRHVFP